MERRGRRGPKSLTPPENGGWRAREVRALAAGLSLEQFRDADMAEIRRAEAVAEERLLQFEEAVCRRLWWATHWSLTQHLPSLREALGVIRGIVPEPPTPAELGEKFAHLAGASKPGIALADVGETLPFKRREPSGG